MTHILIALLLATTTTAAADTVSSTDDLTSRLYDLHVSESHPNRAFVMLGEVGPKGAKTTAIDPGGSDKTEVGPSRTLDKPRTFTIITDQGACEVSTTAEVYVETNGSSGYPWRALELDAGPCGSAAGAVAIEGGLTMRADLPHVTGGRKTTALPLTGLLVVYGGEYTRVSTLTLYRETKIVVDTTGYQVLAELRSGGHDYVIIKDMSYKLRAIMI